MTKEVQDQLISDHFLFKEGDRFLQAANASRFWPTGRGIFHNKEKTFLVWVGEEDHLRIISMQQGGHVGEVYSRLTAGIKAIEALMKFSESERLGWLTFCPTNLGTAIRASVHITLPLLAEGGMSKLQEVADKYQLQVGHLFATLKRLIFRIRYGAHPVSTARRWVASTISATGRGWGSRSSRRSRRCTKALRSSSRWSRSWRKADKITIDLLLFENFNV